MKTAPEFRKTTETFVDGAQTLSQEYFVSPEVFAEENKSIFSRHWILAAHESELAKPGDFIVTEIAAESVIVVRDHEGQVRAFYNVCRHRGSRLCEDRGGHFRAIQCPYHAWTYSLDGRLTGAPQMDNAFNRADYALAPVAADTWEGFVFINLDAQPVALAKWFDSLGQRFSPWKMAKLRSAKRVDYEVAANWKLIFQNYSECYHCAGVHPELTKLSPSDSAENDLVDGPFLGGFMSIERGRSLTKSGHACALPINHENAQRVFYYSIFPNVLLSLHPDYVMVHRLTPETAARTLITCDWLFHPDAFTRENFDPDDAIEFWDLVNRQDWHVCELSQQGISSRAYRPGPYSPRESIPAAWDRFYLRQLRR